MDRTRTVFITLLVLAGVVVGAVLIYAGYWWLARDTKDRRGQIQRHSFEFQQARRDELLDQMAEVSKIDVQITEANPETKTALVAQRKAIVRAACNIAAGLTGTIPEQADQFVSIECEGTP